ncbi:MAG: glycosyltransferase family 2 protein [Elusimicrobiota bacterium]|nr:glycosyltransferase family 2 protein [Elusimicrobiota bacterium]
MKRPTLSVVVPHYNHGRWVEGAVAALLGQSVAPLELILIDDASTDGSGPVLERLAGDPRVRLVRHEKNRGVCATLVEGLRLAQGDFVYTPAADDLTLPGAFEKLLSLLAEHPRAGLACAQAGLIDERGRDLGPYRLPVPSATPVYMTGEEFRAAWRRHGAWVATYTCLFRRDAALAALSAVGRDLGPSLDAFLIHGLGGLHGACYLPERTVSWRQLESGFANRYGRDADASIAVVEGLLDALKTLSPRVHDDAYLDMLRRMAGEEMLNNLAHAPLFDRAGAAKAAAFIPGSDPWLALYRAALAAGAGSWAARLYLFPKRPVSEMARIAARKLGGR